ncbi:hypothetical protein JCM6294_2015 [Bacteroides pyogenes DSM 20611 = JCM 6294]|uniref:Uncharacterized protein n=1 Tax=Bacteroides pyogenes DSM 20611 = JCM 6294 TaxID=1121100 RepID=W4PIQ9_9BACE|nr:hypothetical protein JCM6294_2015 [Bacteroides pyogenes DSM 20611 = JCM 6294]
MLHVRQRKSFVRKTLNGIASPSFAAYKNSDNLSERGEYRLSIFAGAGKNTSILLFEW